MSDDPLKPREAEVLKLIAEAHTNQQIAELLVISPKTVENHRARILEKLGMRPRRAHALRDPPRHGSTLSLAGATTMT